MYPRTSVSAHAAPYAASPSDDDADGDPHIPNSIPPWVHLNEDGEPEALRPIYAPNPPNQAHARAPPAHYKVGRKWDAARTAEPALLSLPIDQHQLRWEPFMQSGPNQVELISDGYRIVDQAWLDRNMPYLSEAAWQAEEKEHDAFGAKRGRGLMYKGKWLISPERQERTIHLIWRLLLKNAFVPLLFRITILAFVCAALGVSASIFRMVNEVNNDPDPYNQCATRASTYMAVCLGAIAIPYLGYITWDEYLARPLGLRSVRTKMALILCDLFFIVFSSANLALAFDALTDHRWACFDDNYFLHSGEQVYQVPSSCPNNPAICYDQRVLSGVLVVGLVAWLVTFSISVLRVVEKLRPD